MSDVPEGYRMSEVGVIPEEWEVNELGDATEVVMGQSPVGTSYNRSGTGAPLINGPTEFTEMYPIKIQWTSQPTKFCKKGDVLLCVRGSSTGRINISNDEYCIGRGVAAIRAKSCADKSFITFQVDSAVKKILALTTGSTFPNIDGKSIRAIQFLLPPLPEQQAIASALSDVDVLITALEQLITKKHNIKQGAMQQLLTGKKRLPGFGGEWDVKQVKQLGEVITGGTPPTQIKENWNGSIPWVTPTDITEKKDISQTEREIASLGLASIRKLPYNSVLITCIASIGKNVILRKDGACNQQINAILPNNKHNADFIYYLMENNKKYILENAGITATNIISKKDFSVLSFLVPQLIEQQAIAQILSDMDTEIEALKQKRDKYRAIKQGMMQELLTGKTRLV